MIELTEAAAKQLKTMGAAPEAEGKLLRILVEAGGCSGFEYGMSFDEAKSDDLRFECLGVSYVIDPASYDYLKGSKVHFDDGLNGKGFEVFNPNAQSTCGCGRSFN